MLGLASLTGGSDMDWSLAELEDIGPRDFPTDHLSWLKACEQASPGRCLVLRHGDVFLPLCLRKRLGLTVLEGLGQDFRSIAGPIGGNGSTMAAIDRPDLPMTVDLVDFRRFPKELASLVFPSSKSRLERFDIMHFGKALGNTEHDFMMSLSKSVRDELRYTMNKATKKIGSSNIRYETISIDADNWCDTWNMAEEITKYSWQGKSGLSVLQDKDKERFLKNVMMNGMPIIFHFCYLEDNMAAVSINIKHADTLVMHVHEYNGKYAKFRPGYLLNHKVIMSAISDGASWLDFGVGDTPHKRMLRCEGKELWRVLVPLTWKGRLAAGYQKLRWRAGQAVPSKRTCGK
jgi:hypothetical protein